MNALTESENDRAKIQNHSPSCFWRCSRQVDCSGESRVIQLRTVRPPSKIMALVMERRIKLMNIKAV